MPADWPGFTMQYRYLDTPYTISVRTGEAEAMLVDGEQQSGRTLAMVNGGATHSGCEEIE